MRSNNFQNLESIERIGKEISQTMLKIKNYFFIQAYDRNRAVRPKPHDAQMPVAL